MRKGIRKKISKKLFAAFSAALFTVAALGSGAGTVYADPTTETATSGGSSSGTETTEEGKVETKILNDDHGRISFWEWERLDETNMEALFGDGKFHPCMFQYDETLRYLEGGTSIRPMFVSTYADNEHIYLPREPVNAGWYDHFDRLVDVAGDQYTEMINRLFGTNVPYHGDPFYYAFDQYENFFIKMDKDGMANDTMKGISDWIYDEDGKLKKKFYTTGGCMGVLHVKAKEMSNGNIYEAQIGITDGSAKGNPADMSYLGMGERGTTDHIYLMYNKSSGEKESVLQLTNSYNFVDNLDEVKYSGHKLQILQTGANANDYTYNIKGSYSNGNRVATLGIMNGWMIPVDQSYTYMPKASYRNQFEEICATRFRVWVGTQHVFASIKGEGGDEETGVGGVTSIDEGSMLIVGDATYTDQNGKPAQAEGVLLPEGSKIVIEKGGVLAIEGNFINKGKIVNNGGVILVKDGGCISPYMDTDEGTITMNGGDMIIMPGGKVYAMAQKGQYLSNWKGQRASYTDTTYYQDYITLADCSNIINYGTVVATRATVSKDSKIENRRGGTAIFGAAVTDSSILLWKFKIGLKDKKTSYGLSCDKEGVIDVDMALKGGGLFAPMCYWDGQPSDNKGSLVNNQGGLWASTQICIETKNIEY
ncbi:hypothetical protein SAMN04487934_102252 [Eubacterium ruminantium]|nr:hypothetical protein SAMN04487934_102252 [Eubacterium ruminantium]